MPGLLLRHCRFLHVPKTGGNWVSHVLRQQFPGAQRTPKIHTTRKSAPRPDAFTFAFVRHPLSWYQSYFSYKQLKGWDLENDWDQVVQSDSFAVFLDKALEETPGYYTRLLRRYVGRPEDEIDFVGRFESLADDLIRALELAGEHFDADRIRREQPINQSRYELYPATYSSGQIDRVIESESGTIARFYPCGRRLVG